MLATYRVPALLELELNIPEDEDLEELAAESAAMISEIDLINAIGGWRLRGVESAELQLKLGRAVLQTEEED